MTKGVATEDEVQTTIVEGLRALGYDVQITSRQRKRCSHCHKYSSGGDGVTKGVADLLVGREYWGAIRMPMEVKGTKTALSPEQTRDYARGMIYIVRSWEQAIDEVAAFEKLWRLPLIAERVS